MNMYTKDRMLCAPLVAQCNSTCLIVRVIQSHFSFPDFFSVMSPTPTPLSIKSTLASCILNNYTDSKIQTYCHRPWIFKQISKLHTHLPEVISYKAVKYVNHPMALSHTPHRHKAGKITLETQYMSN